MKILFYYPSNKRTIALETLLIELRKKGHEVVILTTCEKDDFHFYMESIGFQTFINIVNVKGFRYYLKQIFFLIGFCKKNKIELIHSHLQHVNFIASVCQFFIKAKVIIYRHHFRFLEDVSEKISSNRNEVLFDKIINFLAKTIVVPSSGVYEGIKNHEKINLKKLHIIPYIYDFSKYQKPDFTLVDKIKSEYPCRLRLIMVSRLIKLKRHHIVFPVIKQLVEEGYDIKMFVLDEGTEKENLKEYIELNKLNNNIIMLGFRTDFVNFMVSSDLLIQPSLTDASNSAAKEMAFLGKTVAVSKNVGDYDDYIEHNKNGYLIPTRESGEHLKAIIIDAYNDPEKLIQMGRLLRQDVISKFDISNANEIISLHEKLF